MADYADARETNITPETIILRLKKENKHTQVTKGPLEYGHTGLPASLSLGFNNKTHLKISVLSFSRIEAPPSVQKGYEQ